MSDKACLALAREGDWTAAINRAIQRIKDAHSAVEIAAWLIEAGVSTRPLETEIDRVGQCLNSGKRQFFKLQEWWVIQLRSGIKDLFQLECMFYGVSVPPELEAEERDRLLAAQQSEIENMLTRIKTIRQANNPRVGRHMLGLPHFQALTIADRKKCSAGTPASGGGE